ncbi:HNH/ENDO VII family nuclease [Pseudoalteromonas sp. Of11M-6]|uniref:HNH/ENDO VII family nuclease n=2 Tax=Pseudoalteromonas TaxID=53246 RepID=UPI001EF573ED|nr:HNH/ENDO VII family nuclease [Pseudoalteromonas sp. Of11M-6]MCG7554804.1 HNH/ENDO VII family nuclease [Pseudoalteromonas sp. Of11M-6]
MQQAAQEIGQRVNKALDEYQGQPPIRGVTDKPTKAKADELEPPKGNELPGGGAAVNEKISSSNYKKYTPNMVNNRKMYKSDLDFTSEIPAHIDSSVHKSIRAKIENGWSNLDLMKNGNAPIGKDGKQINLHHILGQEPSPMVELLSSTHKKHHKALHGLIEDGKSFRNNQSLQYQYDKFKKEYWKLRAKDFE